MCEKCKHRKSSSSSSSSSSSTFKCNSCGRSSSSSSCTHCGSKCSSSSSSTLSCGCKMKCSCSSSSSSSCSSSSSSSCDSCEKSCGCDSCGGSCDDCSDCCSQKSLSKVLCEFDLSSDTSCGSISSIDRDKSLCHSSSSTCSSSSSSSCTKSKHSRHDCKKVKVFNVTLGPKDKSKNANKIEGDKCFYVNGLATPTLVFREQNEYLFVINTPDYPFSLTTSPCGYTNGKESKCLLNNEAITQGELRVLGKHLPKRFYYQCPTKSWIGGECCKE